MPREQVFEGIWQFLFVCEIVKWSVKQQSQSASVSSEEEGLWDSVSCYTFIVPSSVQIKLISYSYLSLLNYSCFNKWPCFNPK